MARRRTWTDDDLRAAVGDATTWTQVVRLLRERTGACGYLAMRIRAAELHLDAEHLDAARRRQAAAEERARRRGEPPPPRERVGHSAWRGALADEEAVREAVDGARSYAEVLRRLGVKPGGSVYVRLKERIAELDLDTSSMRGQGWARGRTNPFPGRARPLDEILVANSTYSSTYDLKHRLWKEGLLDRRCAECGITEWRGRPAPLRLDHINGDRRDNRIENLRILCPNCDAFTETHCGRNKGRYDEGVS